MSVTTIDDLKQKSRIKGRREFEREMEERAKAMGYGSTEELIKAAEKARKNPQQQKQQQGKQNQHQRNGASGQQKHQKQNQNKNQQQQNKFSAQRDRELQREREAKERERRRAIKAERERERERQERWAAEAHGELARKAIRIGIKDDDYAITLLTREMKHKRATLSDDDYKKYENEFDEDVYFEGLKRTHPHLFVEQAVPATTGITQSQGQAPPPPGSAQVTQAQVAATQNRVNAVDNNGRLKMGRNEFAAALKKIDPRLRPPTV